MNKVLCNYDIDAKLWLHISLLSCGQGLVITSFQELADKAGLTTRQVRYSLSKLEACGLCSHKTDGHGRLQIVTGFVRGATSVEQAKEEKKPPQIVTVFVKPEEAVVKPIAGDSCDDDEETELSLSDSSLNHLRESNSEEQGRGRSKTPSSIPPISPLPSSPQEKPAKYFLSRKEAVAEVAAITKNAAVREAATEWIMMRYAKRGEHKLTAKAIHGAFQKLRNMGYNSEKQAVACFEQSIEHLWDGLFEVKG